VSGYLTKDEAGERLVEAIRRATRGEVLVTREQMARADRWREEVGQRWASLSGRERKVLKLAAQGKTDAEIAQTLHVSAKTIGNGCVSLLGRTEPRRHRYPDSHLSTRAQVVKRTLAVLAQPKLQLTKTLIDLEEQTRPQTERHPSGTTSAVSWTS